MTAWTSDELDKIGKAEALQISSLRREGTLRKPVTIWVVGVGENLYVRSYRGHAGAWYRSVQVRREGQIQAGGVTKDVTFVDETDSEINDRIDAAYQNKYGNFSAQYVDPMLAPAARSTTIKIVPQATTIQEEN
jgi:hypothetical protein